MKKRLQSNVLLILTRVEYGAIESQIKSAELFATVKNKQLFEVRAQREVSIVLFFLSRDIPFAFVNYNVCFQETFSSHTIHVAANV